MLYGLTQEEIKKVVDGINEGKTYGEVMEELYPKSVEQCLYECAVENMRSFSLIITIYYAMTKKAQPEPIPCDCLPCADCLV